MVKAGDDAPRFTLPGHPEEVDLGALLAGGPVVVFFFPKANTSG